MTRIFYPPLLRRMPHCLGISHQMREKLLIRRSTSKRTPVRRRIQQRNLAREEPVEEGDPEEDLSEGEEEALEEETYAGLG